MRVRLRVAWAPKTAIVPACGAQTGTPALVRSCGRRFGRVRLSRCGPNVQPCSSCRRVPSWSRSLLLAEGQCEYDCGGVATPELTVSVTVGVISGVIGLRLIGADDREDE